MALIVQKFGGTSVGSIERIRKVAAWVLDTQKQGHRVVVVVSAMAGETNRLVQLANEINAIPYSRDYDMIVASGEQVSAGLLSLAINTEAQKRGMIQGRDHYAARPLLGHQLGILTDNVYSKARIKQIKTEVLHSELNRGVIPVVAGFQGVDTDNNITTLGRGGSDTSAVALAAALKADECEIYTDVDGVYTTDPRLCSKAKKLAKISFEEMMEMASLGAKVLQIRSVEIAANFGVVLHVRSSFDPVTGTQVVPQERLGPKMEQVVVSGVAADASQVKFVLRNLPNNVDTAAKIFGAIAKESIVVDVIVQDLSEAGKLNLNFTVGETDAKKTLALLSAIKSKDYSGAEIVEQRGLAKVSVVGVGMQHHPGVASKMFQILASAQIPVHLITTSEIKISCLIDGGKVKQAVELLHDGFELHKLG